MNRFPVSASVFCFALEILITHAVVLFSFCFGFRRYLLTGNIRGGKPWINLCNWSQDWDRMTAIQRKGFRRLYQRGCDCKVRHSNALSVPVFIVCPSIRVHF